jgi:hypothetical protein
VKGLETADERALNDLISAIIVQASMDYIDARKAGLITAGGEVDKEALRVLMLERSRSLPKWMEPRDVFSCVWFMHSNAMQDIMPHNWSVNPAAIRTAVTKPSGSINHHMKKQPLE